MDVRLTGYHPSAHLPAGRILTRETLEALEVGWAAVGYRTMTAPEIEAIVGTPFTTTIGPLPKEFT